MLRSTLPSLKVSSRPCFDNSSAVRPPKRSEPSWGTQAAVGTPARRGTPSQRSHSIPRGPCRKGRKGFACPIDHTSTSHHQTMNASFLIEPLPALLSGLWTRDWQNCPGLSPGPRGLGSHGDRPLDYMRHPIKAKRVIFLFSRGTQPTESLTQAKPRKWKASPFLLR